MIFLTGLLGMMAIGSLAFFGIGSGDDGDGDDDVTKTPEEDGLGGNPSDMLDDLPLPDMPPPGAGPQTVEAPAPASPDSEDPALDGTREVTEFDGTEDFDLLPGTEDNDLLHGDDGSDRLDGGAGADTLEGNAGPDDLYGGAGDDLLSGGNGEDTLNGGDDADVLRGGAHDDALHGRDGADTLMGDKGEDTLFGGGGNDVLSGIHLDETGEDDDEGDFLNGGTGDDTVIAGDSDVVSLGAGADVLVLGEWMTESGADILDYDDEEDQLMVVYNDDLHGDEPDLAMRPNAENPSVTEILMGDEVLATLPTEDAPDLGQIVLIAESALTDLGLDMGPDIAQMRQAG